MNPENEDTSRTARTARTSETSGTFGSSRIAGAEPPDDDDGFQLFVRTRWPALVRTAYLLTGDRHLAEDVTQSALTKAYRSWPRVRRSENPDAYVRRILIGCHKDRFRKRRVAEQLTDALPDTAAPRDDMARADQRDVLAAALGALPKRQRAVVILRYWEDLSEPEVAQILGCSVGTVKSQASKALSKLRASLGSPIAIAR